MKGLTDKQQAVLDYIAEFSAREGMAPTVNEIAEHFGIQSATGFAHLRALQRKGYVDRSSKARSVTLLRGAAPKHLSLSLSIPILGRISAGQPLLAEENVETTLTFDPAMLPFGMGGHQLFGLRVNGDSMKDAGILDGDIIVAKDDTAPRIGDIVVALVGDEATVKYFHMGDGEVELRPANDAFESRFVSFDDIRIQGIVVAMYRTYGGSTPAFGKSRGR